jgi:hypothetical protein
VITDILQEAMMNPLTQIASATLLAQARVSPPKPKPCVCLTPWEHRAMFFRVMKDFALMAKGTGVPSIKLTPYVEEPPAVKDFKAGKCEGVVLTDFSWAAVQQLHRIDECHWRHYQ